VTATSALFVRPLRPGAAAAVEFHPLVRLAFYGFVLSLPFEYPNRSFAYEITTLTGSVFLLATAVQPRACFRAPPAAVWWLFAFLYAFGAAYVAAGARNPEEARKSLLMLTQVILIVWVASNLLRDERIRVRTLALVAVSCLVLALLQLTSVANEAAEPFQRATVLGQNSNRTARMLSLGLLAVIGLTYGRRTPLRGLRPVAWGVAAIVGFAIVQGGSRGGILALALGLGTFAMSGPMLTGKIRNAGLTAIGLVILGWAVSASPLVRDRFARAEAGNLAGRERIFPAAWSMFIDRPLLGWGPQNNKVELAVRLRLPTQLHVKRDTHNLVLEVLTSTGLAGAVPFLIALGLCFRGAWRARHGTEELVPMAMMIALLAGNMSGNYLVYIPYYVTLAYVLASGREAEAAC